MFYSPKPRSQVRILIYQNWSILRHICKARNCAIAGLHVTSRRPCWWSRTKVFLSSGNETLFSCKFFEEIFFCFDPQHGRLVTWLQTKNSMYGGQTHSRPQCLRVWECAEELWVEIGSHPTFKKPLGPDKIGSDRKYFSPIYAMFSQYRMAIALAGKPYRIGLVFRAHKNSDFGAISVTERSCSSTIPLPKAVTQPMRYVTLHYRK